MKLSMTRLLLTTWWLAGTAVAQTVAEPAPEVKLDFFPTTAPALRAFLGDPSIGTPMAVRGLKMVWHPSGRFFVSNDDSSAPVNELLVQVWSAPAGAAPPKFKGFLNVAGAWALSNRGDLLCAQAYRPSEKFPHHDEEYNAVSCFRFADASRIWKFPLEKDERLVATCFSKDDQKILVSVKMGRFCTVRLLDAKTGREESRITLPGTQNHCDSSNSIVAFGDEFVMMTETSEGSALSQVRTNPLALDPAPFKDLQFGEFDQLFISRNEQYMAAFGSQGYDVISSKGGTWKSCLDDEARDSWSDPSGWLKSVSFSPDSRWLHVGNESEAKVIDLVAEKVVKQLPQGGDGACFSPDGSVLLSSEHSGLAIWDPRDWTRRPSGEAQHDCPVLGVRFLPDGKTVISHDHNGFILWDLASRKPRAFLKGTRGERSSNFKHFAFANQMRELIAGDGWDYLRWTLPDLRKPMPDKPEQVPAVRAFGDVANQSEECSDQEIYADATGRHFITVNDDGVQWRDLSAPARIKTLSSVKGIRFGVEGHVIFLDDGKLCLHDYDDKMHHLDISTDQITEVTEHKDVWAQGLWLPGRQCYVGRAQAGIQFIDARSGKLVQTLAKLRGVADFEELHKGGFCVAVSKDEKMAAAYMEATGAGDPLLSLWDIDSGKILALQKMPGLDVNCLDLSLDGKILAVGHKNTAISLWDVNALLESGPPEIAAAPAAAARTPRPKPAYQIVLSPEVPAQGLSDKQGHVWTFAADGSLAVESRLPSFGVIRVNGRPFVSKGIRYMKRHGDEKVAAPFSISNVGEIEGQGIWVDRTLALHHLMGVYDSTVLQAADRFTNQTENPVEVEIGFEVKFPADSQGLLRGSDDPLQIPADGRFSMKGDDLWLAAAGSGKTGETLAAVRVQAWVRPMTPELHWNADGKILRLTYRVEIPAGESRWLVHGAGLVKRFPEGSIDALGPFPSHADVGHYVPPGNRLQGINFGPPDLWNPEHRQGPLPSSMVWSSADPKPRPESDGLGFGWEQQHDQGRLGELGATSVYQVWVDGHPAKLFQPLLHPHVNGKLITPSTVTFDCQPTIMTRHARMAEDGSATVWHDRYLNSSEETRTVRVSYLTTFRSPVVEVWDRLGRKHRPEDLAGTTASLGGACAFVLKGEQQPATLLAFHKEGSPVSPSLRWMGPSAVFLDYEFKLEPKTTGSLLQGACQRPLKAFGGAVSAFSDWLPLKLPPLLPSATSAAQPPQATSVLNH